MLSTDQTKFYQAMLDPSANEDFVRSDEASERLAIYRNTVIQNLVSALSLTYPGVWQLIGETCGNQLAKRFCLEENNLPLTGCLDDWGVGFIEAIDETTELKQLPYLSEFARYEWTKHLSQCAPVFQSLSLLDLKNLLNGLSDVKFIFHPSCQLFESKYPIDEIEALLLNPDTQTLTLALKDTGCLIMRTDAGVTTFWLDTQTLLFYRDLKTGVSLEKAVKKRTDVDKAFDLANALTILFRSGALVLIE